MPENLTKKQLIIDKLLEELLTLKKSNGYRLDFDEVLYYPGNPFEYGHNIICVRDQMEAFVRSNRWHDRSLEVEIEALVASYSEAEASRVGNAAQADIIEVLGKNKTLNGLVHSMEINRVEKEVETEGKSFCSLTVFLDVKYRIGYFEVK